MVMNTQPTLISEFLELRPLAQTDYPELFSAASDPLIWEMHPQPDRYKTEVFKAFFLEAMASHGALTILDRKTSAIIGSSRFYEYSAIQSSVVIGYTFLTRKYWGGLYNRELKKLMINYALKFVKTTLFHVGLDNLRSQKAMIKIGGINTGIEEIPVSYAPPKKSYIYKIETPL
jgi:RimJ/RimL family protein N-acetyltransferase